MVAVTADRKYQANRATTTKDTAAGVESLVGFSFRMLLLAVK
jgi:hypothetical protein